MDAFHAELPDVIFFRVKKRSSQCLKITQNVAFKVLNFGLRFLKTRQYGPFLAF